MRLHTMRPWNGKPGSYSCKADSPPYGMQDDGQGHQEIVPSLLTQDTLNPSFYGMRIIATELEPLIDKLVAQVGLCLSLHGTHMKSACAVAARSCTNCMGPSQHQASRHCITLHAQVQSSAVPPTQEASEQCCALRRSRARYQRQSRTSSLALWLRRSRSGLQCAKSWQGAERSGARRP